MATDGHTDLIIPDKNAPQHIDIGRGIINDQDFFLYTIGRIGHLFHLFSGVGFVIVLRMMVPELGFQTLKGFTGTGKIKAFDLKGQGTGIRCKDGTFQLF